MGFNALLGARWQSLLVEATLYPLPPTAPIFPKHSITLTHELTLILMPLLIYKRDAILPPPLRFELLVFSGMPIWCWVSRLSVEKHLAVEISYRPCEQ